MSLQYKKFLLFGDSITEFSFNSGMVEDVESFSFGSALTNVYTRKMDIMQRGFSGYNSRWALKILPKILETEANSNIAMGFIFFGANDSCLGGHQRVPLEEFVENITKLVQMMKSSGIKTILIGPGLYDKEKWESIKPDDIAEGRVRSQEEFKKYSDAGEAIAKAENVPFVNLNKAFREQGGDKWQDLMMDGIHFSGKGSLIFYNELLKTIRENYPEYAPENIEYKLPNWSDVKPDGSNIN
ncbi:hypothetical protein Kpol_1062p17 [Vanderwaltozyma polyspora DSM 70294]|uniref:Uncharacterized protein n=1 Tax=Vanderwaltozyma polyspora (strain ATCC 22028 / DSM 70294 / BCRC 21397 / CBS 2163 / NBRC 10782 / NRRL Y-8283 / UCD 57-17) TaxID=436907 RepID=A7TK74_VANPO|nr:uncharacterized protein Kpol_1062p17 [Vanderwaltozyma polyspora DSM 70294]EDO17309.1 hypothetical protein Kpol_1062p17 [Vanderwaltozyma polyspora DSM 70294]